MAALSGLMSRPMWLKLLGNDGPALVSRAFLHNSNPTQSTGHGTVSKHGHSSHEHNDNLHTARSESCRHAPARHSKRASVGASQPAIADSGHAQGTGVLSRRPPGPHGRVHGDLCEPRGGRGAGSARASPSGPRVVGAGVEEAALLPALQHPRAVTELRGGHRDARDAGGRVLWGGGLDAAGAAVQPRRDR
eukprot:3742047-Rhodomonas_salina.1